ncbi:MAG: hypothetical protein AMXMBFR64_36920 [Myxococcales bacterium]
MASRILLFLVIAWVGAARAGERDATGSPDGGDAVRADAAAQDASSDGIGGAAAADTVEAQDSGGGEGAPRSESGDDGAQGSTTPHGEAPDAAEPGPFDAPTVLLDEVPLLTRASLPEGAAEIDAAAAALSERLAALGSELVLLQGLSGAVEPTPAADEVASAPYVAAVAPEGPRAAYFQDDPFEPGPGERLARRLEGRTDALRASLDGAPALAAALEDELSAAVARVWACAEACAESREAVRLARARVALLALHVQVAEAELALARAQRAWVERAAAWTEAEARRREAWERAQREEEERAAEHQAQRAEAEAARLAREKAERDAEELAKQRQESQAALERAKARQEEFLRTQKAEELKRQRDRDLEQLYQDIVDLTGRHGVAVEELSRLAALREAQRLQAMEFIDLALKEDAHVAGLLRKVAAGELEPRVLGARSDELAQRLRRARAARGDPALEEASARADLAAAELRSRLGDVELVATEPVEDAELHDKRLELARASAALAQVSLDAAAADRDRLAIMADLRKAERTLYSSLLRRIAPHLPPAHRAPVALGPAFADGLFDNLADLAERLSDLLAMRLEDLREVPGRLSTWKGATGLVWSLGEVIVLLLVALWVRRRLPEWMVRVVQGAGANPWLRRNLAAVVTLAKIVTATGRPAILLLLAFLVGDVAGRRTPEVEAALFVLSWYFVWRMATDLLRALFLPAVPPRDGTTLASIDPAPILRIATHGATAWRSAWAVTHYVIIRLAVLTGIELLLGQFYLHRALTLLFDLGLVALVVWLMLAWRSTLLGRFAEAAPPTWARTIRWVSRNRDRLSGVAAVPPVVVWLLLVRAWPFLRQKLRESKVSRSLANYILRRRMERAKDDQAEAAPADAPAPQLPAELLSCFTLSPLHDEPWLVPRGGTVDVILQTRSGWEEARSLGAVAVIAEPGLGKTTILNQVARRLGPGGVRRVHFDRRVSTERQLIAAFARALGLDAVPGSIDQLRDCIQAVPETTWLVDDAHRLFLKVIGGMEALDAFFELIAATSRDRFWVVTFDSFTWYFIQSLRAGRVPFARVLKERPWTEDEVRQLVTLRTRAAGYHVTFEDLVVSRGEAGAAAHYQVVKTAEGYYRLLCDYADGNPAIVINYWLRSLTPSGPRRLSVGLFSRRSTESLATAGDEVLFTFSAIAEHSGIPIAELARVLGFEEAAVERTVQRGIEDGLLARVGPQGQTRIVIHFDSFRQVVSLLRAKNFIYFSQRE